MNYGFSGTNRTNENNFNAFNSLKFKNLQNSVRVISIVLDENHPRFQELGGWNGLGTIEYEITTNPTLKSNNYPVASPLNPNVKQYPLINEFVDIMIFPDNEIGEINSSAKVYYNNIIGLWNHPHHNGFPIDSSNLPPSQNKDYTETQVGSVRRVTDNSTEINLGNTFKEKTNIHPLLPFEGDIIFEGRWGQSIRLGSTVKDKNNNWSKVGENGDPILIIRNGQGFRTEEGWVPITEDINKDDGSIYFANGQQIPLEPSSENYTSYKNPPTKINQYNKKQIIINSGRLVFNSNEDNILFSSKKSINLNSKESINVDTKNFIVQSNKLFLGSKAADEPLLLGNVTKNLLKSLVNSLNNYAKVTSTLVSTPQGTPLAPLNLASSQLLTSLQNITKQLDNITSKDNFTI